MMFISDDPLLDYDRWEAKQEKKLMHLPRCVECDEPIQDETAYYINGEWICHDCMDANEREVFPE